MNNSTNSSKRTVYAPKGIGDSYTTAINSVELSPNEDVIWTRQHDLNGNKYVSGYTIIKKKNG